MFCVLACYSHQSEITKRQCSTYVNLPKLIGTACQRKQNKRISVLLGAGYRTLHTPCTPHGFQELFHRLSHSSTRLSAQPQQQQQHHPLSHWFHSFQVQLQPFPSSWAGRWWMRLAMVPYCFQISRWCAWRQPPLPRRTTPRSVAR